MILDLRALFADLKKEVQMAKVEIRGRENILIPRGSNMMNATIVEEIEGGSSRITGVNVDGLFTPIEVVNALRWIPESKLVS